MYKNNQNCSPTSFLTGTIVGALIGAGLALLYAPKTGAETRKEIKGKLNNLKKEAESAKEKTIAKISEVKKSASNKAEDIKMRARRAAEEFKKAEVAKK